MVFILCITAYCSCVMVFLAVLIIFLCLMVQFNLRPYANLGLDRSCIPASTGPAQIIDELRAEIPEVDDAVQQVRQLLDCPMEVNGEMSLQNNKSVMEEPWFDDLGPPRCLHNITREDLEIVLLGTGSSQPSKYRNVTSIYINLFSKGGLLFDCGEGTLGQLKRRCDLLSFLIFAEI